MNTELNIHFIFKTLVLIATIVIGFYLELIGIDMIRKSVTVNIGNVSFSAGLALLTIGLILILATLFQFYRTDIMGQYFSGKWFGDNWLILIIIIFLGGLIIRYLNANFHPNPDDKYQILIDLILIIIGLSAAVGYGIYRWIWRNIKTRVEKISSDDQNITKAEVQTSLGFVFYLQYEDAKNKSKETIVTDVERRQMMDYLKRAIRFAESALKPANKLDETEHEELVCRCKSNLAYYLVERKNPQDKKRALELALYAYKVAIEKRSLNYVRPYNWEENYAWVLWHFEDDDKAAKEKVHEIIHGLLKRVDIPRTWRESIEAKWAPLLTPSET